MFCKLENPTPRCELKFADDASGEFEGYASVFDSVDQVNDTISPGAFTKSLEANPTPAMFVNHNHHDIPIGDWVELKEDDRGLFGRGVIDLQHRDGPSAYSAMKRRAMTGLSIGFTMKADDYDKKNDSGGRIIRNMDLKEVSIVTFPCEPAARISDVKASDFAMLEDYRAIEAYLRDSGGFSKAAALALVSRIKHLVRSESAPVVDKSLTHHLTNLITGVHQ